MLKSNEHTYKTENAWHVIIILFSTLDVLSIVTGTLIGQLYVIFCCMTVSFQNNKHAYISSYYFSSILWKL